MVTSPIKELSSKDYWQAGYESRAGKKHTVINPNLYRSHLELAQVFQKYLPSRPGLKLLEFGAGGSRWLPYFAKQFGYEVSGIDYSERGCQLAQHNLEANGISGEIHCLDFLSLPEAFYNNYDVVVSFGVIEHFDAPFEVLEIFSRALRWDGFLVTVVPNLYSFITPIQAMVGKAILAMHKPITLTEIGDFYEDLGYKILCQRYIQFMDLSVVNLSTLPVKLQTILGRCITLVNLPLLYIEKIAQRCGPHIQLFSFLHASMIVIGQKSSVER